MIDSGEIYLSQLTAPLLGGKNIYWPIILMDREYLNNIIVLLVGLISLNLPFMDLNTMSSQSNRINLYISGEGEIVGPTNLSKSSNNLVTIPPTSTNDEFQIYYPKYVPPYDVYYWYSNPLNLNISIEEDVQITIWAVCNKPRYISFTLSIMKYTSSGSGDGIGYGTGAQFVYNEPFEFSVVIPVEELDNNLKDFHLGDYIGIGIMAVFPNPQPPAEVTVLYNSTEHPSHMTINTKSISIDFSNPITIGEKPALDVTITDTFGIYDIADYEVQINGPSGKKFADFEIVEYEYPEQGILILRVIWDKS
ncbi:MAG: hypothetical protein JSW00_05140, partial [Thermoplasmata archaeon]